MLISLKQFFTEDRWAPLAAALTIFAAVMVASIGLQDESVGDALWDAIPFGLGGAFGTWLVLAFRRNRPSA